MPNPITNAASYHRIFVDLWVTADQYQQYYSGAVKYVQATTLDGLNVRFPANILRSVLSHDGIHGRFAIEFDVDGRFQRITRLR